MKRINLLIVFSVVLTSCVSSKLYTEVRYKYESAQKENRLLLEENNNLMDFKTESDIKISQFKKQIDQQEKVLEKTKEDLRISEKIKSRLKKSYDALIENKKNLVKQADKENQKLFDELEEMQKDLNNREDLLNQERDRIEQLKYNLSSKQAKIGELNRIIREKEQTFEKLKNAISDAILGFKNGGLSVTEKNGKIYVSMENKLLFKSGSWYIDKKGKDLITKLGMVLEDYDNIDILIEGHTDDVPYKGKGQIKDNWDLSVMRATSVVKVIVANKNIDIKMVAASGKGEFDPLFPNKSEWSRAKNRRIEIILTPSLKKIESILSSF